MYKVSLQLTFNKLKYNIPKHQSTKTSKHQNIKAPKHQSTKTSKHHATKLPLHQNP